MYGLAGYKHTAGLRMPHLSALVHKQANGRVVEQKGKAGQRPTRDRESKERWKDKKNG